MAISIKSQMIGIKTEDGTCDAYVAYPDGEAVSPAVLFYMDAIGLRPRIFAMVQKIAAEGYFVLAPNTVYRSKQAPIVDYDRLLKPENRTELFKEVLPMAKALTPDMIVRDAGHYLQFLAEQAQLKGSAVGTVGYCMGGSLAMRTAAEFPERVKALASFHGGHLANDTPSSPHRLASRIKAEAYFAHADQDPTMPPEQMDKLQAAFDAAGVAFKAELYQGAQHGFTMSDLNVYNPAAEKRHWDHLLPLLDRTLKNAR